jgi:thioredoxin-like negative regulator of GroEL
MNQNPKPMNLIPLLHQTTFEQLIGRAASETPVPSFCVVYFTAAWCGACKRLDLERIVGSVPQATWFKCDIDQNDYTAGFCGIRSIPTFLVIRDQKVVGALGDSRTEKVLEWLKTFV